MGQKFIIESNQKMDKDFKNGSKFNDGFKLTQSLKVDKIQKWIKIHKRTNSQKWIIFQNGSKFKWIKIT